MPNQPADKLRCEEIFALLSEYLDAELSTDMLLAISAHICACEPCVELVESLKKSIALYKQFEPEVRPAPLNAELRQKLRDAYQEMIKASPTAPLGKE